MADASSLGHADEYRLASCCNPDRSCSIKTYAVRTDLFEMSE
jgi:hypothetical protein